MSYGASLLHLVDTFIKQGYTPEQALALAKQLDKAINPTTTEGK